MFSHFKRLGASLNLKDIIDGSGYELVYIIIAVILCKYTNKNNFQVDRAIEYNASKVWTIIKSVNFLAFVFLSNQTYNFGSCILVKQSPNVFAKSWFASHWSTCCEVFRRLIDDFSLLISNSLYDLDIGQNGRPSEPIMRRTLKKPL